MTGHLRREKIKAKIKRNAAQLYVGYCAHTDNTPVNWEYQKLLKQIENKWINLDTQYIFLNQYNTAPIPNLSKNGMRIEERYINDIDFEGDETLLKLVQALKAGTLKCHSVKYDEKIIVDHHKGTIEGFQTT